MIFGFQRLNKVDPLSNLKSVRAWFARIPRNDAVAAAEHIVPVIRLEGTHTDGNAHRLEAIIELDRMTAPLLELLRTQYRQIAISDDVRQRLLGFSESLAQSFAQAYALYAKKIETDHDAAVAPRALRHAVFTRMFHHLGTIARLGLFRYEQWIPGRWRSVHQSYSVARARSLTLEPFTLIESRTVDPSTAEQEYIGILLLHRLNTGNLTTPQIDTASEWLRDWVTPLRLTGGDDHSAGYWVDLGAGDGLVDRRPEQPQGDVLFLDMGPFRGKLKALIARLMAQAAGRAAAESDDALALAKRVDRLWQPQAPVMVRRGERRPTNIGATVASGWTDIMVALQARHVRSAAPPGYHYDDFGRLRNTNEMKERASRRTERHVWNIVDSSESGYRIRSSSREATRQWPGALMALQVEDVPGWQLAIVRRLKRIGAELTEIGVEVISRNVSVVTPREAETRDSGYTVDGVDVETSGKGFQALYLPPQVHGRVRAPASLVIPTSEFVVHRKLSLTVEGESHPIVLASPLERARDWVWTPLRAAATTS